MQALRFFMSRKIIVTVQKTEGNIQYEMTHGRTQQCRIGGIHKKEEQLEKEMRKNSGDIYFRYEASWLNLRGKSGSTKRGEGGRQQRLTGLTLHPLFPLAFLSVLLLEFGYQARVHVPGLRNGTLLVLL